MIINKCVRKTKRNISRRIVKKIDSCMRKNESCTVVILLGIASIRMIPTDRAVYGIRPLYPNSELSVCVCVEVCRRRQQLDESSFIIAS